MAIRLDERFVVDAPAASVWDFLIDPRRVVECVPGGELGEVDGDSYRGAVRVAVGPLVLAYRGRVRLDQVDAGAHHVVILGEARERGGGDSARLVLESWLEPLAHDRTEVIAKARVEVVGRIAELGLRVLQPLGHAVFQDFAAQARERIEAERARRAAGGTGAPPPLGRAPPLRPLPLALRALGAWLTGVLRARGRGRLRD